MSRKPLRGTGTEEYRVVCDGINYSDNSGAPGAEKRAERGDMVRDLPASAVTTFLEQGAIESVADVPAVEELPEEA